MTDSDCRAMQLRTRFPKPDRNVLVLAAALACGAGAAWSVHQYVRQRIEQLEADARVPTVQRVVAARDLAAGTRIDASLLAVRAIPRQWATADTVGPERLAELEGAVLERPVRGGDPVTPAHVAQGEPPALSARLDSGRRAVTIPVDEINSQSGLLEPGDRIDLYVSFVDRRKRMTVPLLQAVRVLATGRQTAPGQEADGGPRAYSTVTLETSPEDAVRLVAARQSGTLTALLRPPGDDLPAVAAVRGSLAGMLGIEPARRHGPVVPVIYGDRPLNGVPDLRSDTDEPSAAAWFEAPLAGTAPAIDIEAWSEPKDASALLPGGAS